MKLDVCIPALKRVSAEFEEMIRREIPVNRIIYSSLKPLGTARQELIEQVSTDWFAFVDTDVELMPGWFSKVWRLVNDKTGAVDGMWSYTLEPEVDAYQQSMEELARIFGKKTSTELVTRAFTGDTLIRTGLVKDIEIPPVPVWEDEFIKQHITRKGYEWKRTKEAVCLHHRRLNISQAYDSGYYGYYFGGISPMQAVKNLTTIVPKATFAVLRTGKWRLLPMQTSREFRTSLGCLVAWLKGRKYDWDRYDAIRTSKGQHMFQAQ
jgi:glycosyltransferase involved in cell wall biosynthesis